MELRRLRYFVAVADELHFGRAAEKLGIRQPPLSQQIQALEDDLGVLLFDRTSKRVRLTAAGRTLRASAGEILTYAESARHATQRAGRGESGTLVLGFVGSATASLLPRAIRTFRERYPGVHLSLRELTTAQQVRELIRGGLDAGLLRPPLPAHEEAVLDIEPAGEERLVAALPAGHVLARERTVDAAKLAGEPFVLFPRELGSGLYDQILSYCGQSGFAPSVAQEAVQMQTIVALVAAGMGVSIVPHSVSGYRRANVVFRPLRPATRVIHLATARHVDNNDPVTLNFMAVTAEIASQRR